VLSDLILPCLPQELYNICIVSKGRNSSLWNILG
jgi:hypothetical protein